MTDTVQITSEQFETLCARVKALESKIQELTKPNNPTQREMTDADALKILTGEFKELKHNEAAQKLGLSYGQVYSCRGEYTFRHIHKQLNSQTPPWVNPWKK